MDGVTRHGVLITEGEGRRQLGPLLGTDRLGELSSGRSSEMRPIWVFGDPCLVFSVGVSFFLVSFFYFFSLLRIYPRQTKIMVLRGSLFAIRNTVDKSQLVSVR